MSEYLTRYCRYSTVLYLEFLYASAAGVFIPTPSPAQREHRGRREEGKGTRGRQSHLQSPKYLLAGLPRRRPSPPLLSPTHVRSSLLYPCPCPCPCISFLVLFSCFHCKRNLTQLVPVQIQQKASTPGPRHLRSPCINAPNPNPKS